MPLGDTNAVDIYRSAETTWGETPAAPSMTQMRYTGEGLKRTKQTVKSDQLRSDRMRDTILETGYTVEGPLNFELAYGSFDTELEAMFSSTHDTETVTAITISAVQASSKFLDSGNGLAGFVVGQWVKVSGFTGNTSNNGVYKVTAVAAGELTVSPAPAADDAAGESVTITGTVLRNGTTKKSVLYEKRFTDLDVFESFVGCRINTMELNFSALDKVTGTFSVMGKSSTPAADTVSGSDTAADTAQPLTASANVGTITLDGVALNTAIRSMRLNATNNLRIQSKVGQKEAAGIGYGFFEVTGTLEVYFEDLTLYNKLVNHTAVALSFRLTDADGNILVVTLPKVFFTDGAPAVPGGNQDVILPLTFEAVRDSTTNCVMQIDKLAA